MGHNQSSFNKANFRRGIRGYRHMFASLHLEENELKKLWMEFGKIDADNSGTVSIRELLSHCDLDFTPFAHRLFGIFDVDNSGAVDFREFVLATWNCCTMDHDSLVRFAFDLFDRDRSGAIEATEVEAMLREIYGDTFADSPTAALTLKRVRELALQSDGVHTPTKETSNLKPPTETTGVEGGGGIHALQIEAFGEFCRQHSGMLLPAFTLQRTVRSKIVSETFWQGCTDRRNGARPSKQGGRRLRKAVDLQELSTMIRFNQGSRTGTTSDKGTATYGSTSAPTEPIPGEPPAKSPATASPSPTPGEGLSVPTGDGNGIDKPVHASQERLAVGKEHKKVDECTPDICRGKSRGSIPHGEGREHDKQNVKCGKDGALRKRASTSKGMVVVEADEGDETGRAGGENDSGAPCLKTPRISAQQVSNDEHSKAQVRTSSAASNGSSALNHSVHEATTNSRTEATVIKGRVKRTTRQTYPVPIGEGGRGTSAWARGGENSPAAASDLSGFRDKADEDDPNGWLILESRVDYPRAAAARAAAAYSLPAVQESGNKAHNPQARDLVAGNGERGGRNERPSARPKTASEDYSSDARHRRRETGQAAAAARAAARGNASTFGHGVSPMTNTARDTVSVHRSDHYHPKKRGTH